ncbi:MAG: 2,3-bisphosphoglycerate-independent phosphoglycerate mutase [Flavobacteriales bacterium]|jgi:2,3-bisphosphoglycerate-independent phosphoglycerate mutase|nr:2,3-bisphosphoglycerate-independent phosphoglycerate mutase [Flavobacteriales bacterium]|tara:strand:+ start:1280 stop:2803 length:1524 start_codon:yes stop_codon:yes gene_type:complete
MTKKAILVILDGWGHGAKDKTNAIHLANTPFIDSLYTKYPNSELVTYGEEVGLPDGQMGNSEVGHLNIGAGRVVYQDFARINKAVKDNSIVEEKTLIDAFEYAKVNDKRVHLMGLVSSGGIHSHEKHLYKLCGMANEAGVENTFIHAFTDGRDCDPKSGLESIEKLEEKIKGSNVQLASVIGRYYAMDRDHRWERIQLAYDLLVKGKGEKVTEFSSKIKDSYQEDVTDEFLKPIVRVDEIGSPIAVVEEGDVVICFNFRTDRCREITEALTQKDIPENGMKKIDLYYVTMTEYDKSFKNVQVVYSKDNLKMTLGEVVSKAGLKQLRIAETEKYPHVTFFFSGGREEVFEGEKRIVVASPKVATYDLQPEMSAPGVTEKLLKEIESQSADFICLNFANTDMVGHTGIQEAIIKTVETTDQCLEKVVEAGINNEYSFVIIADHGNAEKNMNEDGSPNTAHTVNPVPCFVIDYNVTEINNGKLGDIAPTLLHLMNIKQPTLMTGNSLIVN